MSANVVVGGVDKGVPGLEFGVDVTGVAMPGVDVAEVMIGSPASQAGLTIRQVAGSLQQRSTRTEDEAEYVEMLDKAHPAKATSEGCRISRFQLVVVVS